MKNSEQPTTPLVVGLGVTEESKYMPVQYLGLTKREHFAAVALQGLLSNPAHNNLELMGVNAKGPGFIAANFVVKEALAYADELLKQLEG